MEIKIAKEVLELASRCSHEHRCLNGMLCEVAAQMFGPQRFICHETESCAYKIPFGSKSFCTRPVRRAIYDTYGK